MSNCELCGEPMPEGETMFKYHGYSGNCPMPPLPKTVKPTYEELETAITAALTEAEALRKDAEDNYTQGIGRGLIVAEKILFDQGLHGAEFYVRQARMFAPELVSELSDAIDAARSTEERHG